MSHKTYEFVLTVKVTDTVALWERADDRFRRQGISVEQRDDWLKPGGVIDAAVCLRTVLDPGGMVTPGFEIEDSYCEERGT